MNKRAYTPPIYLGMNCMKMLLSIDFHAHGLGAAHCRKKVSPKEIKNYSKFKYINPFGIVASVQAFVWPDLFSELTFQRQECEK